MSQVHIYRYLGSTLLGHGYVLVILNLFILGLIIYLISFPIIFVINLQRSIRQTRVSVELIPPGYTETKLEAFEKLFTSIYGLNSWSGFKNKILRRRCSLSLEINASGSKGLSFILSLPEQQLDQIKKIVSATLPGTEIVLLAKSKEAARLSIARYVDFKLKNSFYMPLMANKDTSLAFEAGLLNLNDQENVIVQLVISPLSSKFNSKISKKLAAKNTKKAGWLVRLLLLPFRFLKWLRGFKKQQVAINESEMKLTSPLFKSSLRFKVTSGSVHDVNSRTLLLISSLSALSTPGQQELRKRWLPDRLISFCFKYRLPQILPNNLILSPSELACLYHFPSTSDVGHEGIKKSLSRTIPMGLTAKEVKADVYIGENVASDQTSLIGLSRDERARHLYIIGGTGNGKTTMLEYMVNQDINSNKGVMVIDPHGDLAESLIKHIPKTRIKDVIYFNPADINYPIGLNLLELPEGLSARDLAIEKDRITESIISILRKSFDGTDDGNAFRIERLLRNAIYTALTVEDATLFTVSRILSDKFYRWEVIQDIPEPHLKRFWLEEFNKAGDYQRVKLSLGPLARLERFERNLHVKAVIGQTRSGLDFDNLLSSNKILICNLSKGRLSEDGSSLLGSLLLAKLQLAGLRRQSQAISSRQPFYVYVDEFQNYANASFINMFSEARKYGLCLTMAQQSLAQLADRSQLDVILDNVSSLVAFRSRSTISEKLLLPQFEPYITRTELRNLPRYSFYAKLAGTEPKEPFSGQTVLLKSPRPDSSNRVVVSSRKLYAKTLVEAPAANP